MIFKISNFKKQFNIFVSMYFFTTIWIFGSLFTVYNLSLFGDPISNKIYIWFLFFNVLVDVNEYSLGYYLKNKIETLYQNTKKYYKKVEFHNKGDINIGRNSNLITFYPHGVACQGFTLNGIFNKDFKEVTFCVTKLLEYVPCMNIVLRLLEIKNVERDTIESLLLQKKSFAIIPEGFVGLNNYEYGSEKISIKNKGAVMMAIKYGYEYITPVYTFGENDTYKSYFSSNFIGRFLSHYNIPFVCFLGRLIPFCWHLPKKDTNIVTVLGKSYHIGKIKPTSKKEFQFMYSKYLSKMIELYYDSLNDSEISINEYRNLKII